MESAKPVYTWTVNCDPSKPFGDKLTIEKFPDGTAKVTVDIDGDVYERAVTLTPQAFQYLRTHLFTEG